MLFNKKWNNCLNNALSEYDSISLKEIRENPRKYGMEKITLPFSARSRTKLYFLKEKQEMIKNWIYKNCRYKLI